jgi:hypothetical protein
MPVPRIRNRKRAVIAVLGATLALSAGVAVAAVRDGGGQAAIIAGAAKRLGISSDKLQNALQQATIDQINAEVKAGRLTRAQGDELIARVKSGEALGGLGGPPEGFGHEGPGGPDGHGFELFDAAASYLGVSEDSLRGSLFGGSSLAKIATEKGKSVSGLEDAIVAAGEKDLQQAVDDGRLTDAQRDQMVSDLRSHVDDLVNATPGRPFEHDGDDDGGSAPGGSGTDGFAPPAGGAAA